MRWTRRLVLFILAIIVFAIVMLIYWSPQKVHPIHGVNGQELPNSISTLENIQINGVSQRLIIRGWDRSNPVLLHLHGGPGNPDRPFIKRINAHVEDIFTVVYWDQRGVGGSYSDDIDPESVSLQQISKDGIKISELLLRRFNKEKIYLQGHSWGTAVGTKMAQERPDLFHAYIGIGQMASSSESEGISYRYALEQAEHAKTEKDVAILKELGPPPYPDDLWIDNMMKQRQILWNYENPLRPLKQSLFQIYMIYIMHPEYSISDKIGMLKGAEMAMNQLWDDAMSINLFNTTPELEIPVYIMQGKYDKHTVTSVAKSYFDTLKAPLKMYYEFENSAHAPHFEEYDKYRQILIGEIIQ